MMVVIIYLFIYLLPKHKVGTKCTLKQTLKSNSWNWDFVNSNTLPLLLSCAKYVSICVFAVCCWSPNFLSTTPSLRRRCRPRGPPPCPRRVRPCRPPTQPGKTQLSLRGAFETASLEVICRDTASVYLGHWSQLFVMCFEDQSLLPLMRGLFIRCSKRKETCIVDARHRSCDSVFDMDPKLYLPQGAPLDRW